MSSVSSSSSTFSEEAKRYLLSCLPAGSEVFATAAARVYHRPFSGRSDHWTYSGLSGTMVFGRNRFTTDADKIRGAGPDSNFDQSVWFRLIDPVKGLVWLHQIPDTFDYSADKPFFHMFSGKSRMFGFRFDEDVEAAELLKKVTSNVNIKAPTPRKKSIYANLKRRLTPSMVSGPAPGSFVHVAHVGLDSKGRLEAAEHMGHEWTGLLEDLEGHGVSRSVVEDDRDFVEGFITGVKAVTNSPSLSEQAMIASDLVPVTDEILLRKDTV